MTLEQFKSCTAAQREKMHELWTRQHTHDWNAFLANAIAPTPLQNWVGIPGWHGMYIGIEADGYSHS